jgi:hypothetical protein
MTQPKQCLDQRRFTGAVRAENELRPGGAVFKFDETPEIVDVKAS